MTDKLILHFILFFSTHLKLLKIDLIAVECIKTEIINLLKVFVSFTDGEKNWKINILWLIANDFKML